MTQGMEKEKCQLPRPSVARGEAPGEGGKMEKEKCQLPRPDGRDIRGVKK
jgi:hypothetical protein